MCSPYAWGSCPAARPGPVRSWRNGSGGVPVPAPRPGQQAFEKMIAGLYLGEIFRLVLVDLHDNKDVHIFEGQDISHLRKAYTLDSSFLSAIEE